MAARARIKITDAMVEAAIRRLVELAAADGYEIAEANTERMRRVMREVLTASAAALACEGE